MKRQKEQSHEKGKGPTKIGTYLQNVQNLEVINADITKKKQKKCCSACQLASQLPFFEINIQVEYSTEELGRRASGLGWAGLYPLCIFVWDSNA